MVIHNQMTVGGGGGGQGGSYTYCACVSLFVLLVGGIGLQGKEKDSCTEFLFLKKKFPLHQREAYAVFLDGTGESESGSH